MSQIHKETVTDVHHWNDKLFTIKTTRSSALRFENGQFTMIGLEREGKPLMRAYSIASANYEDLLEFFSIKVPNGPLTSLLRDVQVGDEIMVGSKPVGTLVADRLLAGKHLYLLSTGTGLAPFMSIIKDPEVYERFDKVILTHGVRYVSELAYRQFIEEELPKNPFFGEQVREKLLYYPTVTREPFANQGRLTTLIEYGKLFTDLDMPLPTLEDDRFMICGNQGMLKDLTTMLSNKGFIESRGGKQGHFVTERAFVEQREK